jgi:hypothetical protein
MIRSLRRLQTYFFYVCRTYVHTVGTYGVAGSAPYVYVYVGTAVTVVVGAFLSVFGGRKCYT